MPSPDPARRAVVTGLGAVTPIGNDATTYWSNLLAGVPGGGPITSFDASGYDVRIAAEVKDFDPTIAMDRKMARRMSRFIHFAMAAATEAVDRAGLDFSAWTAEQRDRAGVAINTGGGGMEQVIEGTSTLQEKGPGQVSPFAIPALGQQTYQLTLSVPAVTGEYLLKAAATAGATTVSRRSRMWRTSGLPITSESWRNGMRYSRQVSRRPVASVVLPPSRT